MGLASSAVAGLFCKCATSGGRRADSSANSTQLADPTTHPGMMRSGLTARQLAHLTRRLAAPQRLQLRCLCDGGAKLLGYQIPPYLLRP